jgi:2OG-Fe(II) oxygenase superfamily
MAGTMDDLATCDLTPSAAPDFAERLATIADFLPAVLSDRIVAEIEALGDTERSYLPLHKQGGTAAYETLREHGPTAVALYQSAVMRKVVSSIVGLAVETTPLTDKSSCSVLYYVRPGDHIGWHYDHNFYKGRHFTVLLTLANQGHGEDGLSSARLLVRRGDQDRVIPTPSNTLVVFEGAKVLHRVTMLAEGERRIVLSMTYCTDPRNSLLQEAARRVKDTAYFGLRALWG